MCLHISIFMRRVYNIFKLDFNLVGWMLDFLTDRSQCVRLFFQSAALFLLKAAVSLHYYTFFCRSNHTNRHIIKCALDSVIINLLEGKEHQHGPVVDDFISWCDDSLPSIKCLTCHFRKTTNNHQRSWHRVGG